MAGGAATGTGIATETEIAIGTVGGITIRAGIAAGGKMITGGIGIAGIGTIMIATIVIATMIMIIAKSGSRSTSCIDALGLPGIFPGSPTSL